MRYQNIERKFYVCKSKLLKNKFHMNPKSNICLSALNKKKFR